ncbi:Crp/Fnr family transcriptional regulator [uncultured Mobiluncus sp.]|uniref:Crp/Fnr family transcriptional regulator n=1 Tax=uncultured Mobiluncus sp. TaxID=293425 RepID=UPI00261882BF|nr:Crp/Fnr family transcriptional regulator [uncultured Mobiluncus sp.]
MAQNSGLAGLGAVWAEVVAGLGARAREADLDPRFRLAAEGSVQDRIFHLHSGKVKLTRATSMGRDHLLEVLGPTDTFGLNALTDDPVEEFDDSNSVQRSAAASKQPDDSGNENPHSTHRSAGQTAARTWFATATTLEPVHLDWVLVTDAREYLAKHQGLHLELLRALNRQTELLYQRTMALRDVDVPGRIAAALLELMERFGQPLEAETANQPRPTEESPVGGQMSGQMAPPAAVTSSGNPPRAAFPVGGVRLPHGLTQLELGQMAGASRETANKVLADFIARGWIVQKRRSIIIMNEERLRYRAS